jgi:hypothetical protein
VKSRDNDIYKMDYIVVKCGFMNKEEASKVLNEILAACKDLTEKDAKIIPPNASKIESHGYQLEIKFDTVKTNLQCIKEIAQKNNLAVDEKSQKGTVVIYRPCFIHYSSGNFSIKS